MKLLVELTEDLKIIQEGEESNTRKIFIEGPFSIAEAKNNNGRIYPEKILDREIGKFVNLIESGQAVGELDHPDSPKINLKNISHKIVNLRKEGQTWIGKAQVLETPSGVIARNLIENGVKLGISSRALGSLTKTDNGNIVNDDLHMITWDLVARPSFGNALMNAIYEESEWGISDEGSYMKIPMSRVEIEGICEDVKRIRDDFVKKIILNAIANL